MPKAKRLYLNRLPEEAVPANAATGAFQPQSLAAGHREFKEHLSADVQHRTLAAGGMSNSCAEREQVAALECDAAARPRGQTQSLIL
jgi:hypothetical protein